jgi:hypothetical protein
VIDLGESLGLDSGVGVGCRVGCSRQDLDQIFTASVSSLFRGQLSMRAGIISCRCNSFRVRVRMSDKEKKA